jgi:hypothetical protein
MRARAQIVVKIVVGIMVALAVLVTFMWTGFIEQEAVLPGVVAAAFAVFVVMGLRFR